MASTADRGATRLRTGHAREQVIHCLFEPLHTQDVFERMLLAAACAANVPIALVNPHQVLRRFVDTIDADCSTT